MATVRANENETTESVIKRFKRKCQKEGVIGELRDRERYDKPSVKRKKKAIKARKRNAKKR